MRASSSWATPDLQPATALASPAKGNVNGRMLASRQIVERNSGFLEPVDGGLERLGIVLRVEPRADTSSRLYREQAGGPNGSRLTGFFGLDFRTRDSVWTD